MNTRGLLHSFDFLPQHICNRRNQHHRNYNYAPKIFLFIYVGGLNTSRRIAWVDEKLKVGDRVRIKVVEVSAVSPTVKMTYDREELKAKYERLKAELEAKGLI